MRKKKPREQTYPKHFRSKKERSTGCSAQASSLGVRLVSWVREKMRNKRQQEDKREHIIYFDRLFFSRTGEETSKKEGRKQKGLITVLTAIREGSQIPFAVVVPSNGGGYYARDAFLAWIKELGWVKVTIQFDQENAWNKLYERVRNLLPGQISIRKSPRYSSQPLADGDMINGWLAGKIRTWLAEISESYKMKFGTDRVPH